MDRKAVGDPVTTAAILTARDWQTIRTQLLSRLAARFAGDPSPLDVQQDSDAWMQAQALAILLEGIEQQAADAPNELLPDSATGGHLLDHGTAAALVQVAGEAAGAFRRRVLAWWQEHLPTFSPADVVARCEQTDFCDKAYVYPLLRPYSTATYIDGAFTIVVLGAPQGSGATDTRVVSGANLANINAYLINWQDEHGVARVWPYVFQNPITSNSNYSVEPITPQTIDVTVQVTNDANFAFPFTGSYTVTSSGSSPYYFEVAGDQRALLGLPMIGSAGSAFRGNYIRITTLIATYDGVHTHFTYTPPAGAGSPLGKIYPCPPNWETIQAAYFAFFDALGPGDTTGTASRYPAPNVSGPTDVLLQQLRVTAVRCQGVLGAAMLAPLTDTTALPKQLIELGAFLVVSS